MNFKENVLVWKAKRGDKDAYGNLYLKYLDSIYRYIYFRVEIEEVAEDLTQDVFVKGWESVSKFKIGDGSFKSWLYKVARNETVDYFRKNGKTAVLSDIHADPNPGPLEKTLMKEDISELFDEFRKLTPEQREIVALSCIEKLPAKEISKVTEKSEDAIRAIKYRGLQKLKKILK